MITRRQNPKETGKKKSKSPLFHELHGRQSEIINAVILRCRKESIPCIPVNDELIVPFTEGHKVRAWMLEEIYKQTGVKAIVAGHRYNPHTKTSCPCPEGYCPECWDNRVAYKIDSPFPCSHQPLRTNPLHEIERLEPEMMAV
jgi:hypothetical protein